MVIVYRFGINSRSRSNILIFRIRYYVLHFIIRYISYLLVDIQIFDIGVLIRFQSSYNILLFAFFRETIVIDSLICI
jgi:hypothetical protein